MYNKAILVCTLILYLLHVIHYRNGKFLILLLSKAYINTRHGAQLITVAHYKSALCETWRYQGLNL